jgi:hypothetical protein
MSRNPLLEVNMPKKCLGMLLGAPLCKSGSSLDLTALSKNEDDHQTSRDGKLRRVFTTHARRRSTRKKELVPGFNLSHMMKEPLRVVHSVPLSFPNG